MHVVGPYRVIFCAAKVAERKKTKNNPFFHLKISEFCVLNVPTKSALGWNCIEPETTSLTMQGLRRRHLAGSVVPLLWLQSPGTIVQTPSGWG